MRSNRAKVNLGVLAITLVAGLAAALPASAQLSVAEPLSTRAVLNKYPGAKAQMDKGRVVALYGKPMAAGRTPEDAVELFLRDDKQGFDVQALDLQPMWSVPFKDKPMTAFVYQQYIDGLPVEYGQARILVHTDQQLSKVVLAGAKLAKMPEGKTLNATGITGAVAQQMVARIPDFQLLEDWTKPELVVYFGEGDREEWIEPVKVWKFQGSIAAIDRLRKLTFFVNATTGALVHARNDVLNIDVEGTVQAFATPTPAGNCAADHAGNPPVLTAVPNIRINGSSVYTDAFGAFLLPNAGSTALNITAGVSAGQWARVTDGQGTALLTDTENVLPPGPANLLLNPTPSEFTTAQANAFIHQTRTHNHFRDRAPSFPNLDTVLPANANLTTVSGISSCNAVYSGDSTNFIRAGGGCNNSAFSMVVAHEYGHHIVNQLGLAQGAFGEGFGDVMAMMIYDDSVMGRFFRTDGSPVRTPLSANIQYPCSSSCGGAVHCCGQMLSAVCWRIKTNFQSTYGAGPGFEMARQLNVDWALITNGGSGSNSAHPTTAIEYLTVDDNDGDLENGTPNYSLICAAFSQGGIACPTVALLDFVYPSGLLSTLPPNQPTAIPVNIVSIAGSPVAGTGQIHVSVNGGAFVATPMAEGSPNQYMAALPASDCGANVRYYFSAGVQGGGTVSDPPTAPTAFYSATVATGTSVVFSDDFETNQNWNSPAPTNTATAGNWTRGNPNGTLAQPEDDHTADPANQCFFTGQGSVGGALGEADVDGGITYLVSPAFDLTGADVVDASISYWRWYSNDTGGAPNADTFLVQISNNGTTWTTVETVGPSGAGTSGGWIFHEFKTSQFPAVTRTANMRLRFVAQDTGTGSLVEAAVDDVLVESILCEKTPPPTPPGAFGLVEPLHGATEVPLAPTFQWTAADGAATYTIKIDDDSSLATPIYQQSGLIGTSTSVPPGTLVESTTYWWGVVASNVGGDTSSTPGAASFTTIVPPPTCEADANGDGNVDSADLSVLLSNFGGPAAGPGAGDFNDDGQCNSADLSVLLSQFGQSC